MCGRVFSNGNTTASVAADVARIRVGATAAPRVTTDSDMTDDSKNSFTACTPLISARQARY